jgi:hypothetical protein
MAISTVVVGVPSVRFALVSRVDRTVGVDALHGAVVLKMGAAVGTVFLQTAPCLRTNTNSVADLHVLYVRADSYGLADNLVADDTSWLESAW